MEHQQHQHSPIHLAWHETLEIHELVAFQSLGLMKLKKVLPEIDCPELRNLYQQTINGLSQNLRELLEFYPMAPRPGRDGDERNDMIPFYAGALLALAKTSVRNYSIAITETATPALRQVLTQQLIKAIDIHANVFNYMYRRSDYPSYDLKRLLEGDVELASKALSM